MSRHIQILVVEDSLRDTELIVHELRACGFDPEWNCVETEEDYLRHLHPELDLIISDYTLPKFSGMRALELRNQRGYDIPFIVISGTIGEETAVESIKSGATDYLLKDRLGRLGPAVQQALEQAQLRQIHRKAEIALVEGENKFRTLFDSANDPIYMLHEGVFVDCNAKGSAIYGRTRDEIVGHSPDEFCPATQPDGSNSREKASEIMGKALAGEPQFFEWVSNRRNGVLIYSEVSLNRVDLSGKVYLQAIARDITERKEAEERRVHSLALLRATLDSTADGILTIGLDRQILSYNGAFAKMWRIPADTLAVNDDNLALQSVLEQLQNPDDFLAKIRHLYDHPLEESFDVLDFKDGRVFERVSRPMLVDGKPVGRVWSFRDVTERKRSEQAISDSELRFRTLVDQSPVGIGISRHGIGLYANHTFLHMFGLKSIDDFIGRHVSTLFAPEVQEESRERIRRRSLGLPAADDFETVGMRSDGATFPMHVVVAQVMLADGEAQIGFLTDITERKRAEAQIAEQAAFLDKARDAIIVRDLEGKIVFWNKGAERVYGWTRDEAVGRHVLEVLKTNSIKFKELNAAAIAQGEWTGELQHVTKDKCEITCEVRCTLIRDDACQPKLVFSINTDVTDKKKIEAQFLRAQRMESIGTLAGGIAHDLNNILAPIMMSIAVLKTTPQEPQAAKILDVIEVSAQRGADIVRQVLTFARGLEGERTEVEPKELLNDLGSIISETFPKDIRLQFSIVDDCWPILGDPTQLHQILLNLCVNARDAMPHGGDLIVEIKNCVFDDEQAARTFQARLGRYVNINVTDSGMGIPPDLLNKVFEPFFTTKDLTKGTGLGLSTVMAIVKSHHGFVSVQSSPGRGTTFQVYLPALESASGESKEQREETCMPRGNGETILVVDDEVPILTMTRGTLQAFGYRVLTAHDGVEALALYGEHGHEVAVVLTDLIMPRMDGPALIQSLQQINPAIKIVVTSGLSAMESSGVDGIKHFLPKPLTAQTLLKTIHAVVSEV